MVKQIIFYETIIAIASILIGALGVWLVMFGLDSVISINDSLLVSLGIYTLLFVFREPREIKVNKESGR